LFGFRCCEVLGNKRLRVDDRAVVANRRDDDVFSTVDAIRSRVDDVLLSVDDVDSMGNGVDASKDVVDHDVDDVVASTNDADSRANDVVSMKNDVDLLALRVESTTDRRARARLGSDSTKPVAYTSSDDIDFVVDALFRLVYDVGGRKGPFWLDSVRRVRARSRPLTLYKREGRDFVSRATTNFRGGGRARVHQRVHSGGIPVKFGTMGAGHLGLLAGASFACVCGACSLLVKTSDLSGGPAEGGDGAPVDAEAAADSFAQDSAAADAAADSSVDSSVDSGVADALPTDSARGDAARDAMASDSGGMDAPVDGSLCKTDLSNIGTGDFTVSLTLTTSQTVIVAVANQRNTCNLGMFWDVRLSSGNLLVETDDNVHHAVLTTSGVLADDGSPHAIKVQRKSQRLTGFIDGQSVGTVASTASFGALPPLEVGVGPCDMHTGNAPLVGSITGLCLTTP
jgi:hypothetical protein